MRFPFRRSHKQKQTAVENAGTATLSERAERIVPIMQRALLEHPEVGEFVANHPELLQELESWKNLTEEQLAALLDLLEAGIPEKFIN